MSLLKMQLRQASFRGVAFAVSSATNNAGRRTALHEYPLRDTPYVEDLGRATRTFSLTAIIAGTDYISRTQRLMTALEKPGAGKLVHPWLGEINVVATDVGQVVFDNKLGMATVTLKFVEAGELVYPSGGTNWLTSLRSSIGGVLEDIQTAYDSASNIVGQVDSVVANATRVWGDFQQICSVNSFLTQTGLGDALSLVGFTGNENALSFAKNVVSALDCSSLIGTKTDFGQGARNLVNIANNVSLSPEPVDVPVYKSDQQIIIENANAIKALARGTLIANAVGCASVIGTDDDESGQSISYDDFMQVRSDVCAAIDREILLTEDDGLAQSFESLRSVVHKTLTERARGAAKLVTLKNQIGKPLVVIAYEQYQDADRADEIGTMNAVRNIGFANSDAIKVLSE